MHSQSQSVMPKRIRSVHNSVAQGQRVHASVHASWRLSVLVLVVMLVDELLLLLY